MKTEFPRRCLNPQKIPRNLTTVDLACPLERPERSRTRLEHRRPHFDASPPPYARWLGFALLCGVLLLNPTGPALTAKRPTCVKRY